MDSALRRLNVEEPESRLAILSTKLAKSSLALAVLALVAAHARGALARFFAVLTFRPNSVPDPGVGLFFFLAAVSFAALAIVVALAASASIWVRGRRGVSRIVTTLALVSLLLPYPAWLIYSAGSPPWLADISTDVDDPPAFLTTPEVVAARGGWTPAPFNSARGQGQLAAYPDVASITLDMEMDEAFRATHEAVQGLHWKILDEIQPGGAKRPEGHIEALAFSPALHLPVAIAIRLGPGDDETVVDMRAATRYLPNDLGAGASLIGKLSDALSDQDSSD
ncbi:DUF1499 domain-containing protein [Rhodoblastus acidophilus]|uniref:DUF1499 domain-containing protein n=1 Tax=Candidatus Rhodoblastus alkanivorans TaxID=2954117 RepID=A0ABS9Z3C2_9HYPH|nr:DUF1499 domain-containing protein [Candidatus Rhodoblastus alkanivorans]MCI4678764.1 DUF1499 domain-containing protein [Candidatus Rhodoblastus alkanivorans]MCI4682153.1 DUF1499 domain-containing protein [Candidatus Rhodoblastus alkanivorans]MDI4639455.1 DUF1499 domain-containing protein [Rhodoblastus acidophilus]